MDNYFLEKQWKVDKILEKTSKWTGLSVKECSELYEYAIKNSPQILIDLYIAFLRVRKYMNFIDFIHYSIKLSCCGIKGTEAGKKLRTYLAVKKCLHD